MIKDAKVVLDFWFADSSKWYMKSEEFDSLIRTKFSDIYDKAVARKLDAWIESPLECLALIVVLDQFSRNMFRNQAEMYAADDYCLEVTHKALQAGHDQQLPDDSHRQFMYMPLMHSENLDDQNLCVDMFSKPGQEITLKYAEQHRDIVKRFGRFPHRNKLLGRESTVEEVAFLKQPGSSF